MHKTYPPGVREQIRRFMLYKNGKQMVKRYLAILSSPGYADSYRKPRSTKKRSATARIIPATNTSVAI
ncbi:MAG: hypothetical protein EAZ60_05150 [Oscillatoriales cyanobacterium]|nr:hypothetical protein [Microcoleus sp. PH2017_11_PCY_U_A]TAF58039.1 MAG: hypothetical protein EAZ60_05150 [Oscillatoriales cyanobacterium]